VRSRGRANGFICSIEIHLKCAIAVGVAEENSQNPPITSARGFAPKDAGNNIIGRAASFARRQSSSPRRGSGDGCGAARCARPTLGCRTVDTAAVRSAPGKAGGEFQASRPVSWTCPAPGPSHTSIKIASVVTEARVEPLREENVPSLAPRPATARPWRVGPLEGV
jgi:hypothetical protein